MTAKIVTLVNQKGGVGKTTTAINLGASLAACERNILLVDLDPQANATSGLGLSKNDEKSIYPVLTDGMSIREIIKPTELPNFHVAPSSVDLVAAELGRRKAEHLDMQLLAGRDHLLEIPAGVALQAQHHRAARDAADDVRRAGTASCP